MRSMRSGTTTGVVIAAIVGLGIQCTSMQTEGHGKPGPVELTGTFDPYECHDEKTPDAGVLKPRPDCGSCHARGRVYRDAQGMPRLFLSVRYEGAESKPRDWDMPGKQEPEGIVFGKPKFRLVYSHGQLRGTFRGRMNAKIRLIPRQDDREQPARAAGRDAPAQR